jgi:hypothetical protein
VKYLVIALFIPLVACRSRGDGGLDALLRWSLSC